jgi:hypothetical protein
MLNKLTATKFFTMSMVMRMRGLPRSILPMLSAAQKH